MSNIVKFAPMPQVDGLDRQRQLIAAVAGQRHDQEDVFWLKENAELLGVLASSKTQLPENALTPLQGFYDQIETRLRFFPQYYRFFLSICLDLEDLGMAGNQGAALSRWVADQGLPEAELSDLQRAEARRLLRRRRVSRAVAAGGLGARLRQFISRSATFALPNKKAAYELTHIVYYLSDYGRIAPELPDNTLTSLYYTGLLAYLDQDHDLLAEVCAALSCVAARVPPLWPSAVTKAHQQITLCADAQAPLADGFHLHLVCHWALDLAGKSPMPAAVPQGPLRFMRPAPAQGALAGLSQSLLDLGVARSGDWGRMRGHVLACLGPEAHDILLEAEHSTPHFEGFFEIFARADQGAISVSRPRQNAAPTLQGL
jgi:Domain of unknown function (DUF6902)